MKNNVIRVIAITLLVALAVCAFSMMNVSFGDGTVTFKDIDTNTVTEGATDTTGAASSVQRIIGAILTVTQVIGVGVAVIMLIVLAIKYISAAPSDKAEIKKHMVVYVVGAVVLFAASGILEIIKRFAVNIQPAS